MSKLFGWIKNHKLTTVLFIVLFYLLIKQSTPIYQANSTTSMDSGFPVAGGGMGLASSTMSLSKLGSSAPAPASYSQSGTTSQNRMVIADSYLSLVVKKVEDTHSKILKKVQELGGYMVSSSVDNPQDNANASLTVRIPSDKLESALTYFKSLAVKVVSENLTGDDITNQYTDLEARLKTLNQTKAIFEDMLTKATLVPDILNVQREIINMQDQIDAVKGQTKYLEESSSMAKITIYLSTDELSLPYAPLDSWRPAQIMKEAVRSVISTSRAVVNLIIWVGVYGILWIPALIIFVLVKKRFAKKNTFPDTRT